MIRKTFANRCYLVVINLTIFYLFGCLRLLGLVVVARDGKTGVFSNSQPNSVYAFLFGIFLTGVFTWHIIALFGDPNLSHLYSGVGNITATILAMCSLSLVAAFYTLGFWNRGELLNFYNHTTAIYRGFTLFYDGKFASTVMIAEHVDSEEELSHVYKRVFNKVILVNSVCLTCIIGMAMRAQDVCGVNAIHLAGFHLIPYLFKSLTSSMMYLGICRTSFLFRKLNMKLLGIRDGLRELTSAERRKTQFEKMSQFCRVSDQIDELGVCFENVNGTAIQMTNMYKYHLILVLSYSIIVALHELFIQYQAVSRSMRGDHQLDLRLLLFSVSYIIFNIVELFLVVNITDSCHAGSLRVGKTLQSLLYFDNIDVRLKQSVRIPLLDK